VLSVESCPKLESGSGCLVTAAVEHENGSLIRLDLEHMPTVTTTALHPFYSLDRNDWVRATDIDAGERLQTRDGYIRVERATSIAGRERVFNIEVDGANTYFAGDAELRTHNSCFVTKTVNNTKVHQRDDIFDPGFVDKLGRTNVQRMQKGLPPIGIDGFRVNLHHTLQEMSGPLMEILQTAHKKYHRVLHINPSSIKSGIDRRLFRRERRQYWRERAKDFATDE
jgi:hypothetical protein